MDFILVNDNTISKIAVKAMNDTIRKIFWFAVELSLK